MTVPPTHKHPTVSLIGDVEPKVPRAVSRVPRSRMKGKQPCPGAKGKVPEPSPPGQNLSIPCGLASGVRTSVVQARQLQAKPGVQKVMARLTSLCMYTDTHTNVDTHTHIQIHMIAWAYTHQPQKRQVKLVILCRDGKLRRRQTPQGIRIQILLSLPRKGNSGAREIGQP